MRMNCIALAITGAVALCCIGSCTKKKDDIVNNSCSTTPGFVTQVAPIIQTNCATNSGCHVSGSVSGPGPLTSYTLIKGAAERIKTAVVSRRMPLGATLSEADIQKIRCWVDAGAPQN